MVGRIGGRKYSWRAQDYELPNKPAQSEYYYFLKELAAREDKNLRFETSWERARDHPSVSKHRIHYLLTHIQNLSKKETQLFYHLLGKEATSRLVPVPTGVPPRDECLNLVTSTFTGNREVI